MSAIEGFAVLWDDTAAIDGRPERFAPFAFIEPIGARLLVAHDRRPGGMLANTAGSLRVDQDDTGLRFAAELDAGDPYARRALAAIGAGLLIGCSFGFRPFEQDEDEDGVLIRRARLTEITLCGNGAYQAGGVWAADAERLPPRLEALRAGWHNSTTDRRPGRVLEERAAFRRQQAWSAALR
jgi:HK97 family phage prohead protease